MRTNLEATGVRPHRLLEATAIPHGQPVGAQVDGVELVICRNGDGFSVLYGRCLHRGALLADGVIDGENLLCGLHGWDYRIATGISAYDPSQRLQSFDCWLKDGDLYVDGAQVARFAAANPQGYDDEAYQGRYDELHSSPAEPYTKQIAQLARDGLSTTGHDGPIAAMGVDRAQLPSWDHLQFATAQLARFPLLGSEPVDTSVVIGPGAARPLRLEIPIFVSDMSFGALSEEAKVALARGAESAGTAICSGEGGMLPEEQAESSRYLYELASGRFGWSWDLLDKAQGFHLKFGQGAKTGTGGHLPGTKVVGRIAEVRHLEPGTPAISPARFEDWTSLGQIRDFLDEARARSGGIPIGVKMSAQHVERDLDAAVELGVDYVILDGRGGATGAAPTILRDNISVPTMAALARARRHLDHLGRHDITLVATGGLRTAADFAKAMALGADAVAVANSALQAIGCIGMRACQTDNCPKGIATQKPHLRARLPVAEAAERLGRFLTASTELMTVLARACGHRSLSGFCLDDLTTFDRDAAHLTGVAYGGVHLD